MIKHVEFDVVNLVAICILLGCILSRSSSTAAFLNIAPITTTAPSRATTTTGPAVFIVRARPDSSAAVADALRISKEFGSTSNEARLAWETVEEMDAADQSPAMMMMIDNNVNTPLSDHEVHSKEYKVQMMALNRLLSETKEKLSQIKTLAANLKELDIEDPTLSKLPASASGLKTVLQEAKAASEVFGPDSKESVAAWNEVDFCTDVMGGVECHVDSTFRYSAAALKAHHLYDAVVDAVFFQEAQDAVEMLQNLHRFVRIEAKRLSAERD
jgi:hypothetical protein